MKVTILTVLASVAVGMTSGVAFAASPPPPVILENGQEQDRGISESMAIMKLKHGARDQVDPAMIAWLDSKGYDTSDNKNSICVNPVSSADPFTCKPKSQSSGSLFGFGSTGTTDEPSSNGAVSVQVTGVTVDGPMAGIVAGAGAKDTAGALKFGKSVLKKGNPYFDHQARVVAQVPSRQSDGLGQIQAAFKDHENVGAAQLEKLAGLRDAKTLKAALDGKLGGNIPGALFSAKPFKDLIASFSKGSGGGGLFGSLSGTLGKLTGGSSLFSGLINTSGLTNLASTASGYINQASSIGSSLSGLSNMNSVSSAVKAGKGLVDTKNKVCGIVGC